MRKTIARENPDSAIALQNTLKERLPTRHILEVLANIEHWMRFTRHFGPLSGNMAKLSQPAERYLLTIFAMCCNLGPSQAARHLAKNGVTPHMLSFVNSRWRASACLFGHSSESHAGQGWLFNEAEAETTGALGTVSQYMYS